MLIAPPVDQSPEAAAVCRQVVAQAETGDMLGAIAFGHAANRALHDPVLEHCLVALRAAAFASVPVGQRTAPPSPIDPSPGLRGMPEIAGADLTPALLAGAIGGHGSLLVRGLVPPADALALSRDVERAYAAYEDFKGGAPIEQTNPWYARVPIAGPMALGRPFVENNGAIWTADSPRVFHRLIELFEQRGLLDIVAGLLAERPALSIGKSTLRRAHPDVGTDWWHQDGAFLGADIRALNVWLALTPCGVDAPGLEVFADRLDRIIPPGTDGAAFNWSVGRGAIDRLCTDGARIVTPSFEPGDALLFDEMMLHRTGVRPGMTRTRWAIETWFFAPSTFPMAQLPLVI